MADIYKVAVGIALTSNYAEVLGAMAGQLRGIDGQVQGLIGKWDSLGASMRSTLTGLTQIAGSVAIADFLAKATEAGGELVKFQGQLANLGKSAADIGVDTQAAMTAQIAVHGTNAAGNLKVLRELSGVTATSDDAREILQSVLKNAAVVSSLIGGSPEDYVQSMVKAAENRGDGVDPKTGKISAERLIAGVHAETAAIVAAGGLVTPQQMLGIIQQAGPMARMDTDPDKFYQGILSAAMDMTGQRAGTALTALGRQLLGGKMSKPTAEEMTRIGLLDQNMWHKSGTGVVVDPGGLTGEDILKGPGGMKAWMEQILTPKLKAAGFDDQASQMQELYKVFGTETARRMAALFVTSQAQAEKDASLQRAAAGQDLFGNVMGTDLGANTSGLSNALQGLMQVLGAPLVKPAIAALTTMTSAVNTLFSAFAAHPDLAKNTAEVTGFAGLFLGARGVENIAKGLFGSGGLGGSAVALNTSAGLLNEAAYALGAKGVPGVGGGIGGKSSGGSPSLVTPLATAAATEWLASKMGDLFQALPHQIKTISGKAYDPEAEYNRSMWDRLKGLLPQNADGSVKWFSSDDLHKSTAAMHWNGGHGNIGGGIDLAKLPPVNVAAPQVSAQVNVKIGDRELTSIITEVVNKVIGGMSSSFSTGAPMQNSGTMMPAVDGGH